VRRVAGLDDPWLRLGASPEFLGIVNAYRGGLMRLNDLDNWYTVPDPDGADRVASQRWHRDGWEDHHQGVHVLLRRRRRGGPFEYVTGSASGGKYGSLWPWEEGRCTRRRTSSRTTIGHRGSRELDRRGRHDRVLRHERLSPWWIRARIPRPVLPHYISAEAEKGHKRLFDVDWSTGDADLPPESRYALE
jgi:hypothetical protein